MRAIVVDQIGSFSVQDIVRETPGPGEVLVRMTVTGLCRTDLKIIRVGHRDLVLPRVPGEEVVGTIVAVGAGVADYQLEQRVYIYPGTSCGHCRQCLAGAGNLCRDMQIMGFHRDGGFAEYVLAPAASLIPIPEQLSDEDAVFAEPLSCCLNALELSGLRDGETIGIWGGGPAGSLTARASLAMGAQPFVVEQDERRRDLIKGFAVPPENGFDVCLIAVGDADAYQQALQHLNPRGRLVIFSGLPKTGAALPVDFNQLHYFEQTLVGAYGCSYRHSQQAVAMLSHKEIAVRDLISHRLPLWELDHALDLVEKRLGMKILLYP